MLPAFFCETAAAEGDHVVIGDEKVIRSRSARVAGVHNPCPFIPLPGMVHQKADLPIFWLFFPRFPEPFFVGDAVGSGADVRMIFSRTQ